MFQYNLFSNLSPDWEVRMVYLMLFHLNTFLFVYNLLGTFHIVNGDDVVACNLDIQGEEC